MKQTLIDAKQILLPTKKPDSWFGVTHMMNIYRGCEHGCIYCDSRSECYRVEDFDSELVIKQNAPMLLQKELVAKRKVELIGTGAMTDPYTVSEKDLKLTQRCLKLIEASGHALHMVTKSDLILRDIDILKEIKKADLSVAITLTTTKDSLAKLVEPNAPPPSRRLLVMEALAQAGITVGVTMMPILPYIEDTEENILAIVQETHRHGGKFILPWFGVTLRDRQRAHFYKALERNFPTLKEKYQSQFQGKYFCECENAGKLSKCFYEACRSLGIETKMRNYAVKTSVEQLKWF